MKYSHFIEYIMKVAQDPTLYESYFEWKKKPYSPQFIEKFDIYECWRMFKTWEV